MASVNISEKAKEKAEKETEKEKVRADKAVSVLQKSLKIMKAGEVAAKVALGSLED